LEGKRPSLFFRVLDNLEDAVVTVLLSTMVVVVFLQVVFRFLVKASLPWSEELARYLMVWTVFIGASMGAKVGAHVGVEAFLQLLPMGARRYVMAIGGLITFTFCLVMVKLSLDVVQHISSTGQVSPAMLIPMYLPYLALPVGFCLMAIRSLQASHAKLAATRRADQ